MLVVRNAEVARIGATGLPLGMFCSGDYLVEKMKLGPGDSLVLYTDGVSETRNAANAEYGVARLAKFVGERHALPPKALAAACLKDLQAFAAGAPRNDDLTIMVLRRAG